MVVVTRSNVVFLMSTCRLSFISLELQILEFQSVRFVIDLFQKEKQMLAIICLLYSFRDLQFLWRYIILCSWLLSHNRVKLLLIFAIVSSTWLSTFKIMLQNFVQALVYKASTRIKPRFFWIGLFFMRDKRFVCRWRAKHFSDVLNGHASIIVFCRWHAGDVALLSIFGRCWTLSESAHWMFCFFPFILSALLFAFVTALIILFAILSMHLKTMNLFISMCFLPLKNVFVWWRIGWWMAWNRKLLECFNKKLRIDGLITFLIIVIVENIWSV